LVLAIFGGGTNRKAVATFSTHDSLVTEWNLTAMSLAPKLGTHMGIRTLAMMHIAIYDAVMALDGRFTAYHATDPAPEGTSPQAAAASAAYHVLFRNFNAPEHQEIIQELYDSHLSQIEEGPSKTAGIYFGRKVAKKIILLRSSDGAKNATLVSHQDGTLPGKWRRTASGEPMAPGWGQVTPWVMMNGNQFNQSGPPLLSSREYAAAYEEARTLGSRNSSNRTTEQAAIARFWNPHVPAKWYGLAREISQRQGLTLADSARLFALLGVTLADSAISGWNMKYSVNFWRPETAIRLGDEDTNNHTEGVADWESFIVSPAFPEYVSGHSLTCAASATILSRFLKTDQYTFTFSTMGIPEPRSFSTFSAAAEEAGLSRIYGGIHFRFSHLAGREAGRALGNYIYENHLTEH
jgi:hypothetical protein